MRSRPLALLVATAVTSMALAACGGSPTAAPAPQSSGGGEEETNELATSAAEVYDTLNGLSGQEPTDELVGWPRRRAR